MRDLFNSTNGFATLAINDLLEAREAYHYHLMNKKNVVATAIGYYRIRKNDIWPTSEDQNPDNSGNKNKPRTLENSEVRPYSWPSVLVFVDKWESEAAIKNASDVIPKTLFLSDGRKVPVCIIEATSEPRVNDEIDESKVVFPKNIIGGGYPLIAYVQGVKRIASVGCLVTDGHLTYAITNKHVTGEPGTPIYSILAGEEKIIGYTSDKQLDRVLFKEVYPGWAVLNTYLNMDIGLIEVLDLNEWKTEVFSIGAIGRMADLHNNNITLDLIGQLVSGYGSISGKITGEIKALFYRYKSVGGFEYVSDFLIGSRNDEPLNIHHGDSGTILLYERPNATEKSKSDNEPDIVELMPIAILWGQQVLAGHNGENKSSYALATCLSTACNILGVDILRGWNLDQPYTWGKVGHYTVAFMSIDAIKDDSDKLKEFMKNNRAYISFERGKITGDLNSYKGYKNFCPLADVPDIIFKMGGEGIKRGGENPNHYADIDLPREKDYKSIRDLMEDPEKNFKTSVWNEYYEDIGTDTRHKGILPFRVWQIFKAMVEYVKQGKRTEFLTAAGILTHYVGDACQPLHSSYMSQGEILNDEGEFEMYVKDVHGAYEDKMLDAYYNELLKKLDIEIPKAKKTIRKITAPRDAGLAIFDLMCETQDLLKPRDILDFCASNGKSADKMWKEFGTPTAKVIARGCQYMARIWEAAWTLGDGDNTFKSLTIVDKEKVKDLYTNHKDDFIPSVMIGNIDKYL